MKITLEQIDFLRERANVSYKEAKEALEQSEGDMVEALVMLEKQNKIVLEVEDTGIGIPKGDIPLIFNRFYRVDKSRSKKMGGSGLGLSIAKWIVDEHHGRILVKSKEGEGTRISIVLPYK